MRIKLYFLFLVLFLAFSSAHAQKEHDWIIKISPIKFFRGDLLTESFSIGLALEKKINNKWTVEQYFGYITKTNRNFSWPAFRGDDKLRGFRIDSEVKYYFQKKKMNLEGLSIGGKLLFIHTTAKDELYSLNQQTVGEINRNLIATYLELGWQFFDKRFVFSTDLYAGPRFISSNNTLDSTSYPVNDYGNKNYAFGSGFSLGYGIDVSIGFALK